MGRFRIQESSQQLVENSDTFATSHSARTAAAASTGNKRRTRRSEEEAGRDAGEGQSIEGRPQEACYGTEEALLGPGICKGHARYVVRCPQSLRFRGGDADNVAEGLQVMLDTRPVRTASKAILTLPPSKRPLAAAIALEWDLLTSAQQALKQHYIPLTSLTSRAMDIAVADGEGNTEIREQLSVMLMRYLSTDTLLCWAPEHNPHDIGLDKSNQGTSVTSLRKKQMAVAEPIIAHLTSHLFPGVEIHAILGEDSILPTPQPKMTQEVIRGWIAGLPPFELAGLERAVLASKSLLVAIRLLVEWSEEFKHIQKKGQSQKFGIAEAAEACSVEVTWQTNMWGEVEDTHDVEREDLARQLGSVILLVN